MTETEKKLVEPEKPLVPEEAVPIESGTRYLMVLRESVSRETMKSLRSGLDERFGKNMITVLAGCKEPKLYKIDNKPTGEE